jgi:superfamily II DNA helicase RecQ
MSALVRHFGDYSDSRTTCGLCDFCAPGDCIAQRFRKADAREHDIAARAIEALRKGGSKSTGKLHSELYPSGVATRDDFEQVLGGLARAGYVRISEEVFEKDGRIIPFRKASLAPQALESTPGEDLLIKTEVDVVPRVRKRRKAKTKKKKESAHKAAPVAKKAAKKEDSDRLQQLLKQWRAGEAKKRGIPAFRIFTDQALQAIAARQPSTVAELLALPGIGISTAEKYGAQIFHILGSNT